MANGGGSDSNFGKLVLLLLLGLATLVLIVLGLANDGGWQIVWFMLALATAIGFIVAFFVDSKTSDKLRMTDTHDSQLHNMEQPPQFSWKHGKAQFAKHRLTHGNPVPGPWDSHVSHDEYHYLATDPRYRGVAHREPGEHPLDIKRRQTGEDAESGSE